MAKLITCLLITITIIIGAAPSNTQTGPPKEEISLKQYFDYKFEALKEMTTTLALLMKERMDGFPDQFPKKADYESLRAAIAALKEATDKADSKFVLLGAYNEQIIGINKELSRINNAGYVTRTELLAAIGFLAAFMFGLMQYLKKKR